MTTKREAEEIRHIVTLLLEMMDAKIKRAVDLHLADYHKGGWVEEL